MQAKACPFPTCFEVVFAGHRPASGLNADMVEILQHSVPYDVFTPLALPGVQPLAPDDWVLVDEAYGAQMLRRADLIATQRDTVIYLEDEAKAAAQELLEAVLDLLQRRFDGFEVGTDAVRRPDGTKVGIDRDDPLGTLGHLVQEDLCLMQKRGDEHVLTGAVLCFPAGWRLCEKAGHPLMHIHTPVDSYDAGVGRRVQRLFDGVRAGQPMWRFNVLWYEDPELHQPHTPADHYKAGRGPETRPYMRSERQCIVRLPKSGAVLFSIHNFVVHVDDLGGKGAPIGGPKAER